MAENNIPIYYISVTHQVNQELDKLLQQYGGKSFNVNTIDGIKEMFDSESDELDMLDSDGDGLYDTYEVNGVRIQNGTVAYTDPYNADTDGDGVSDWDEVGGLPYKLFMYMAGHEYVTTINYQVSDPNDTESTGKELMAGYMVVDDFDYLPYSKKTYENIFINNTQKVDLNGNAIYGLSNIYCSNPNELSASEVQKICSKVKIQCSLVENTPMNIPLAHAKSFLLKYINNKDERNFYDCAYLLGTSTNAMTNWAFDTRDLMLAAESCLGENETVILTQMPNKNGYGVNFRWTALSGFLAIGAGETRLVAKVSFDGTEYTMDLKYYIFDYYDWDEAQTVRLGLVSDSELYKLCRCGIARFYENWGVYETKITWEPQEDIR